MKAYYAHCIAIYSTPQEDRDVATLEEMGFTVSNPNRPDVQAKCDFVRGQFNTAGPFGYNDASEAVMHLVFRPLVEEADVFVFRALPDGRIPSGVALELQWARDMQKPVIELPSNISSRGMTLQATREYLHEIGAR